MSETQENPEYKAPKSKSPQTSFRELTPTAYVGFSQYPDQFILHPSKAGFTFNILCVGQVGTGKTTLINTLFNLKQDKSSSLSESPISHRSYDLHEGGTLLHLNIAETQNYGMESNDWSTVSDYIDSQHNRFLEEELSINRNSEEFHDSRIHCCFYFIPPSTRNRLRSFDSMAMLNLSPRVNLVPLIAKSDSLTRSELKNLKTSVLRSLRSAKIEIFDFTHKSDPRACSLNAFLPFAVVGSTTEVKLGHRTFNGRQYPWGVVQVDNESHCDFVRLREAVIRTNMQELIDSTDDIFECYRKQRLEEFGCLEDDSLSIDQIYLQKKAELINDIQFKESALRNSFMTKIKQKEAELRSMENELCDKNQKLEMDQKAESMQLDAMFAELNHEIAYFTEMRENYEAKYKKKK